MNRWQILFLCFGSVALATLIVFPPQYVTDSMVRFQFIGEGLPIDWIRMFLWAIGIVFVSGLGIAINKQEHK